MLVGIDERNYEFRRFFNADHPYYALNIPSSPVIFSLTPIRLMMKRPLVGKTMSRSTTRSTEKNLIIVTVLYSVDHSFFFKVVAPKGAV